MRFIVENHSSVGTIVGSVVASDPDAGDTLTWSIIGGNTGGAFTINSTTGQLTVVNPAALDFAITPTFNLTIEVEDGGSLTDSASMTIVVERVIPLVANAPLPPTSEPGPNDIDSMIDESTNEPPVEMEGDTDVPPSAPTGPGRRLSGGSRSNPIDTTDVVVGGDLAPPVAVLSVPTFTQHIARASRITRESSAGAGTETVVAGYLPLPNFPTAFIDGFNELRDEVDRDELFNQALVGSSLVATTSLSVGYVIWLIRGGVLLSSVLSSLPAWRMVDPLPVLGYLDDDEEPDKDDESLETLVAKSNTDDGVRR